MLFLIFKLIFSEITTEVVQKDMYVRGTGTITLEILQSNGDFAAIENVFIENGPTIVDRAFAGMKSLQTITISSTVQLFQNRCFYRNHKLKKFIVLEDNPFMWTDGVYLYQNNNKTLVGTVVRPSHFQILSTVETLSSGCFASVVSSTELVLPKTIKSLSEQTFVEARLSSVRFEKGCKLEVISRSSISWCTLESFAIPPSVREIQSLAFYRCYTPRLHFEDVERSNLTKLCEFSFERCNCREITMPNGVTSIPDSCFLNSGLVSIRISAGCSWISATAFGGCSSLSSVTVDPNNPTFMEVNGSLYSRDGTQLIFAPPQLESFTITAGLESISTSAVQSLVKVDRIVIEEGNRNFTTFDGCLYDYAGRTLQAVCGGVKQLNVSENATSISGQAGKGVGLTMIRFLGDRCGSIGANAFDGCVSLASFIAPPSLTSIGTECFIRSGLLSFSFEANSSLDAIGTRAFANLKLTTLKLPRSLRVVGPEAFDGVSVAGEFEVEAGSVLEEIYGLSFSSFECRQGISMILPITLRMLGGKAFYNSRLEVRFEEGSKIDSLRSGVFGYCLSLRGTFSIPAGVEVIYSSAFEYCTNIERIEFAAESKLREIVGPAFKGCNNLVFLELPECTESIDYSSISGCFNLTSFTVSPNNKNFSAEGNILYSRDKREVIVCSPGETTAIVNANVESIRSNGFFQCSKLKFVEFNSPSKLETISQNTFGECSSITSVALPSNLRAILDGAFSECGMLSSVTFGVGSRLERIGPKCFLGCHRLSVVSFNGDRLTEIGESAFDGCGALDLVIPMSVERVKGRSFRASGISRVELKDIEELGEGCFQNCMSLSAVVLHSLARVPPFAFDGCSNLRSIQLSPDLVGLGGNSFSRTGIANVTIPARVAEIGAKCFSNCEFLRSVNFSGNVIESVCGDSFVGCERVERVIYCGTRLIERGCGFPQRAVAFVTKGYTGARLCGLPPRKQLGGDCSMQYPTGAFTAGAVRVLPGAGGSVCISAVAIPVIVPHSPYCGDGSDCDEGGKL